MRTILSTVMALLLAEGFTPVSPQRYRAKQFLDPKAPVLVSEMTSAERENRAQKARDQKRKAAKRKKKRGY